MVVISAKAGIHPAVDTGFRRYDKKEQLKFCLRQGDDLRAIGYIDLPGRSGGFNAAALYEDHPAGAHAGAVEYAIGLQENRCRRFGSGCLANN